MLLQIYNQVMLQLFQGDGKAAEQVISISITMLHNLQTMKPANKYHQ